MIIVVLFRFTYLYHPDQPLAHSSVSSYQRLYSPASNKVHSCTGSLLATVAVGQAGGQGTPAHWAQSISNTTAFYSFLIYTHNLHSIAYYRALSWITHTLQYTKEVWHKNTIQFNQGKNCGQRGSNIRRQVNIVCNMVGKEGQIINICTNSNYVCVFLRE